jgi:hypothetical protein
MVRPVVEEFTCQPAVATFGELKCSFLWQVVGAYQGEGTASASRPCPGP